jgi:hypothetical protein
MYNILASAIYGILFGTILAVGMLIYENLQINRRIKEQNSKMVQMYRPGNGFCRVAKTEEDTIEDMIKNYGWTIVEDK